MFLFQELNCFLHLVFLDGNQIKGDHLRWSVYSSWAVDVNVSSWLKGLLHNLNSPNCILDEVRCIHILNWASFVFDSLFTAQSLEVVRGYSMFLVIFVTLDGKDCVDVVALQDFKISLSFRIWSNKDIRSYLWKFKFIDAAFVNYDDVSSGMNDILSAGITGVLMIEFKNSPRFSFRLKKVSFSHVAVVELLLESENLKGVSPYLIVS